LQPNDVAVRQIFRAGPAQTQAALTLLPELLGCESLPPSLWLARSSSGLLGAGAFIPVLKDASHPGFRCMLRVLPGHRRQQVGRALLTSVLAEAGRWGVPYLHAWQPVRPQSDEAQALSALGFRRLSQMNHFVGSVDRALPASRRLEAGLRARARVPARMSVLALHEVPRDQVVSLYQRQLGGSLASVGQHIEHSLECEQARAVSVAAWDGQRVHGFMLLRMHDGLPQADFWVSEPDQRNGWVAALTLHESLSRIEAIGFKHYRFHCNENVRATMNFAHRTAAECVAVTHCMGIDLRSGACP
jgi:GNAT superfamily N-acetyltransferase